MSTKDLSGITIVKKMKLQNFVGKQVTTSAWKKVVDRESWLIPRKNKETIHYLKNPNHIRDTHREKALSNKTLAHTKSTNMDIWVVGTSNQRLIRVLKLKQNFQKNKVVTCKTPFFVILFIVDFVFLF